MTQNQGQTTFFFAAPLIRREASEASGGFTENVVCPRFMVE